jgi:hypothetical protein
VFGASALVFVVAAHNTNIETKFWSSYLPSHSGWTRTTSPTTGDMRSAQARVLLKVSSGFSVRFPVLIVPRPTEIPVTVKGTNGVAR